LIKSGTLTRKKKEKSSKESKSKEYSSKKKNITVSMKILSNTIV